MRMEVMSIAYADTLPFSFAMGVCHPLVWSMETFCRSLDFVHWPMRFTWFGSTYTVIRAQVVSRFLIPRVALLGWLVFFPRDRAKTNHPNNTTPGIKNQPTTCALLTVYVRLNQVNLINEWMKSKLRQKVAMYQPRGWHTSHCKAKW